MIGTKYLRENKKRKCLWQQLALRETIDSGKLSSRLLAHHSLRSSSQFSHSLTANRSLASVNQPVYREKLSVT